MCHEQYITSKQEIFSGNIQTRVGLKPFMYVSKTKYIYTFKIKKDWLRKK